ncbi:hypothetical protein PybrP1_008911 [[Pythium] brassicae (nom. inval.)]|nr:hypothetical protein PybrP1_008911 [[Pythium] brassicae (nom. inval.)]
MVGMGSATGGAGSLRRPADVSSWLARRQADDVTADALLAAIRSAGGSVPLGGADGGAALGQRPSSSPPSLGTVSPSSDEQEEDAFWALVRAICALPASAAPDLQALDNGDGPRQRSWQRAAAIRDQYFAERRAFFRVRVELLRVALYASPQEHANWDAVDEAVDELLKEGLLDALLDEAASRRLAVTHSRPHFFALPSDAPGHAGHQQQAQQAWELQWLEEDALLRHLLLLALCAAKDKLDAARALATIQAFHTWDDAVVPDAFTSSVLALPQAHASLYEARQLGVLVAVRLLRPASLAPLSADAWRAVLELSRTLFAGGPHEPADASEPRAPESVQGVLSLAYATLLAHQFQEHLASAPDPRRLEAALQNALATAERAHGFFHLHALLQALVFADADNSSDDTDAGAAYPFLQPRALAGNPLWQLPSVVAGQRTVVAKKKHRGARGLPDAPAHGPRAAVFQHVGADLLNDVLGALRYLDGAADLQQVNAMAKLASAVLANPRVAEQTLLGDGDERSSGNGLAVLVRKAQALVPQSALPTLRLFTALCAGVDARPSPLVIRQVLKDFSKPLAADARSVEETPRLLPPDEFVELTNSDGGVRCTRSFYYEDDQLAVPAGATGRLVESAGDGARLVRWHLECSGEQRASPLSLWDSVFETAEAFVAHVQSASLLEVTTNDDMETLASFFEWLVQANRQVDTGRAVIDEIGCRWAEAQLRRWWLQRRLPSAQDVLPLLLSQRVSLSMLLGASREDLVAWGIRDRYTREQVLAQAAATESLDGESSRRHQQQQQRTRPSGSDGSDSAFERDGLAHLLRLVLGVLDEFLHERRMDDDAGRWSFTQLHFVSAAVGALSALTASDAGVSVLVDELSGGSEDCVNLVLKTARKLFELRERLAGDYPVVTATLDIAMNLVRWFLSREAQATSGTSASRSSIEATSRGFASAERNWFVGAVEFAIEILSTHESWRFAQLATRWELTDRCFRLVFALLTATFAPEDNAMLDGLQAALRKTMASDVTLVMKLLRATTGVVSIRQHPLHCWTSVAASDSELEGADLLFPPRIARLSAAPDSSTKKDAGVYPLSFDSDETRTSAETEQLESLAVTALRLICLLVASEGDDDDAAWKASAALLLTSIDDGGSKARTPLNLITLCGGYLAYPVEQRRDLVWWSLKLLRHAAVFLEGRGSSSSSPSGSGHTLSALFQGPGDLSLLRDAVLRLLRTSLDEIAPLKTQRLVALIERFLVASEQLMEEATDLLCHVLHFLVQVWQGATRRGLAIHAQIVDGLRAARNFWPLLTRALKIRLSLDADHAYDDGYDAAMRDGDHGEQRGVESAYVGRSSPFGSLARGYILQIVSYEWHYRGAKQRDHPLALVLETFRTEELYSHWLRTFTRLDYSQARFADACARVPQSAMHRRDLVGGWNECADVPPYLDGLICDTAVLQWQLRVSSGAVRNGSAVLRRAKWCNLQGAFVQAQCFSLRRWKVFMELCCLQPGDAAPESLEGTTTTSSSSESTTTPTASPVAANRFKRKESMIASPPRVSATRVVPASPLDLGASAKPSSFSGDRTSFGMIQVLSDILSLRQQQSEADASLDFVGLEHLRLLVELLVSMLHHQLCHVVHKTRDPKLSQTRRRPQRAQSRLTTHTSLGLVRLVEKTAQTVELSLANSGDADTDAMFDTDDARDSVEWKRLVGDVRAKTDAVGVQLRTSLLTASLLLVRHVASVGDSTAKDAQDWSLVLVKLVHHCMRSIKLCDARPDSAALRELFHVSWSLLQEILDGFVSLTTASTALGQRVRLDSFVALGPLVALLEHEHDGLAALFDVLIQRFREKKTTTRGSDDNSNARVDHRAAQEQALVVLTGLTAVIWNPTNRKLWRRVLMTSAPSELRLLPLLATRLVPLLRAQMAAEDAATGLHGYAFTADGALERSVAHRMWCALLGFAAGLLQLLPPADDRVRSFRVVSVAGVGGGFPSPSDSCRSATAVWEFLAQSESLLLAALRPETRLTSARVDEQVAALRFLNAVSGAAETKTQWKQGLPRSFALLMEQSRLLLRRACVLLGSSHSETTRLRQKKTQGTLSATAKGMKKAGVTTGRVTSSLAAAQASLASFSFAHQTLLHEHLQAVVVAEKRHLPAFYRASERRLAEVARQASALLLAWTAGLAARDAVAVVGGVRVVDAETLVPLLAFEAPARATSLSCEPSLGHLCLTIGFLVDQLEQRACDADDEEEEKAEGDERCGGDDAAAAEDDNDDTRAVTEAFGNTVDVCAVLFLKTFVLQSEQAAAPTSDVDDTRAFFQRLNARIRKGGRRLQSRVDQQLLETIEQVSAASLNFAIAVVV